MATTARGIEYPASTDAPRVWEDMQALAESVDDAIDAVAPNPGISIGATKYIVKGTAESVASSTTLQDDDHLTFTMVAGATYEVEMFLSVSGSSSGNFKTAWSVPGDAATLKQCMGPAIDTTAGWVSRNDTNGRFTSHGFSTAVTYKIESNGSFVWERSLISSATGGTLTLQWAQATSNATDTTISGPSYLKYTRVS